MHYQALTATKKVYKFVRTLQHEIIQLAPSLFPRKKRKYTHAVNAAAGCSCVSYTPEISQGLHGK